MRTSTIRRAACVLTAAAFFIEAAAGVSAQEKRAALVIGNSAYKTLPPLKNSANDAADMATSLSTLGFEVITLTNTTQEQMETAVRRFGAKLGGSEVGLFFYSGHGVQSAGVNYLIPVDADVKTEMDLKYKTVQADFILDYMNNAGSRLNIVILDACRDNPFAAFRTATRGLAVVSAPKGSMVVYSTSPGSAAEDGSGRNGTFTSALLKHIGTRGLDVKQVFDRVGQEVQGVTGGKQVPWLLSSYFGTFQFAAGSKSAPGAIAAQAGSTSAPSAQPGFSAGSAMTVERAYGSLRIEVKSAGRVLVDGVDKGELPAGGIGTISGVEAGSRTVEVRYGDGGQETRTVTVEKDRAVTVSFSYAPPSKVPVPADFIMVEGGTFTIGDTFGGGDPDEKPTHQVTVSAFLMAKTEVTQRDFWAVMGFNPSSFKGDDLPVENVTWYDAITYCNGRSRKEGLSQVYGITGIRKNSDGNTIEAQVTVDWAASGYRLPTETEWEYAAKGGNRSRGYKYSGGSDISSVGWYRGNSNNRTQPVGYKQLNELGLYDMSGNVWEWCWDWYGNYTMWSQKDPKGPTSGGYRVIRGGSWYRIDVLCRSACRFWYVADIRNDNVGFRPVRSPP